MKTRLVIALSTAALLAGCGWGDSSLNPFSWFRSEPEVRVAATATAIPADPRPLVAQVLTVGVERTTSGAILTAIGLPPTQGYYDAELVALNDGRPLDGVLRYEFRASPPPASRPAGTQPSREISAAQALSANLLAGVARIEVIAATNRRAASR